MLGRVANGIFWMYRYLERAENTARLLAAGQRMTLTRGPDMAVQEWRSVLTTLGLRNSYEKHHDDYEGAHVCDFVLRSPNNPESVLSMIENARSNARTSRSAITSEVWEAVNEGWMTLRDLLARPGARLQSQSCAGRHSPRSHAGTRGHAWFDAARAGLSVCAAWHLY